MEESLDIHTGDLSVFKSQVKKWLAIDEEISKYELKIRELKKVKKTILEPQITSFMVNHNVKDLNTKNGKLRCNQIIRKNFFLII